MPSLFDYAALSAIVYNDVRGQFNKLPDPPPGWSQILYDSNPGFTAGAYKNGNDIVIALKGSDAPALDWNTPADWIFTNLQAGIGLGSSQLVNGALFYEAVKAANPGANITFTGHSLGGGLASVMAVYFNKKATTFDEAPYELSAVNPLVTLAVGASLAVNLIYDSDFAGFVGSTPLSTGLRASNVEHHYVSGEILYYLRMGVPAIYGSSTPIEIGGGGLVSNIDLHSMVLASSLLMQDQFRSDTVALPNLLQEILDKKLYAFDLGSNHRDFFNTLLNDQIKVGYTDANGLLSRFAGDLDKLTMYGPNLKDATLGKALIDTAIADYYFMQTGFTKDFYTAISGGISFDLTDIKAPNGWATNKTVIQLDNTITQQFNLNLETRMVLAQDNAWTIQSGDTALTATGAGTNNDAMIGGSGGDALDGGDGNDFLYGGEGADTLTGSAGDDLLIGGAGNDTLNGGAGNDTYLLEGSDTITDADGKGTCSITTFQFDDKTLSLQDVLDLGVDITSNGVDNVLVIGMVMDWLIGGAGADVMVGGAGNDQAVGEARNDVEWRVAA